MRRILQWLQSAPTLDMELPPRVWIHTNVSETLQDFYFYSILFYFYSILFLFSELSTQRLEFIFDLGN